MGENTSQKLWNSLHTLSWKVHCRLISCRHSKVHHSYIIDIGEHGLVSLNCN